MAGLAILGNARLLLLPVALAVYVAWRTPVGHALTAAALVVGVAALVVTPWVVRNKVQVGCYAITTDARALWKANNENTRAVLDGGGWIDDVPELAGAPPWPELAADLTLAGKPTSVDECAQMRLYRHAVVEFWREHPGEKALLAVQATRMLWGPVPRESDQSGSGAARLARKTVEPAFVIALYALALVGVFLAPPHFVGLAALMLAYNTLAAMVFAGHGPVPRAVGLPPRATRRLCARVGVGARATAAATLLRRRGLQRSRVELLGPLHAPLRRELPERSLAARRAHRFRARKVPCERHDGVGERGRVRRGDDEPGLAVGHDLRQSPDGARDHGARALHCLEGDHAEALPERRDDRDRRILERAGDGRDEPEEPHRLLDTELAHVGLQRRCQRPAAGDVEGRGSEPRPVPAQAPGAARDVP